MYIDNRVLMPFAMPFAILGLARALWAASGLAWNPDPFAIALLLVFSITAGAIISMLLWAEEKKIGGFWIGRKP